MENLDAPFAIEEISGELFTMDFLDREIVGIYTLTVIGSDMHPTEPLSSSVLVTVLVGDINDHWPQFMNTPYEVYVPIELAPGEILLPCDSSGTILEIKTRFFIFMFFFSFFFYRLSCLCGESSGWRHRHECTTALFNIWTKFGPIFH